MQIEPEPFPIMFTRFVPVGFIVIAGRGDDLQAPKGPPLLDGLLFFLFIMFARHLDGFVLVGQLFFLFLLFLLLSHHGHLFRFNSVL